MMGSEQGFGPRKARLARRCQPHSAGAALQEPAAEPFLKVLQPLVYDRLDGVGDLRGTGGVSEARREHEETHGGRALGRLPHIPSRPVRTPRAETARFVREAFAGMEALLGPLHSESYALVLAANGHAYDYGGRTQEGRWAEAHPG